MSLPPVAGHDQLRRLLANAVTSGGLPQSVLLRGAPGIGKQRLALWLAAPATSHACAVCFSGSDESRLAFILTTVFLTFLPLAMIGGVVTWLALRVRRQAVTDQRISSR